VAWLLLHGSFLGKMTFEPLGGDQKDARAGGQKEGAEEGGGCGVDGDEMIWYCGADAELVFDLTHAIELKV